MMPRLLLAALALPAALVFAGGCGGDSSGSGVAELAPPGTPIFLEAALRPPAEVKANADAAAERIAGVGNLGDLVVSELESAAEDDGRPFDFEAEVEPWLGEHAGVFWASGESDESNLIVETSDAGATQEFIDDQVERSDDRYRPRSYEGVDYVFGGDDRSAVGLVGDFLVATEGERRFKQAVDASQGDSLAGEERFAAAVSAASDGSIADVYVDIGGLIDQSDGQIDPIARQVLQNAGIDPSGATAVASIVPGVDRITVELSSDLAGREAPTGDASALLGSLPGDAFAGLAVSGFGKQVSEAVESLDEEGIPGAVPPGELRKGLKELGIDLEGLTGSLRDAGLFAVGDGERTLGGALVLTSSGSRALETIADIGSFLRSADLPGVTALEGRYRGFSIRDEELGDKPLVVAARKGRIAIGYGLAPALSGLAAGSGKGGTLAGDPAYDDAVAALGETPIGGFASGPAALRLADSLIPESDGDFEEARKYLSGIRFLALGSAGQDDLATAKLVVGLK